MDSVGLAGVPELLVILYIAAIALAVAWPAARICDRLGFPRWLGVLAIIPVANLALLWFVALARWPSSDGTPSGI
jgi:predicted PurR-regulated permease PerM